MPWRRAVVLLSLAIVASGCTAPGLEDLGRLGHQGSRTAWKAASDSGFQEWHIQTAGTPLELSLEFHFKWSIHEYAPVYSALVLANGSVIELVRLLDIEPASMGDGDGAVAYMKIGDKSLRSPSSRVIREDFLRSVDILEDSSSARLIVFWANHPEKIEISLVTSGELADRGGTSHVESRRLMDLGQVGVGLSGTAGATINAQVPMDARGGEVIGYLAFVRSTVGVGQMSISQGNHSIAIPLGKEDTGPCVCGTTGRVLFAANSDATLTMNYAGDIRGAWVSIVWAVMPSEDSTIWAPNLQF